MKLSLYVKGVELTRELKQHVERRARAAVERHAEHVRELRVRITDVNGPRGGEDVHCKIHARLAPGGELIIEELHENPFGSVARAAERVSHGIARRIERVRARRQRGKRPGWRGRRAVAPD